MEKMFLLLKKSQRISDVFFLWKGITSPSLGTGTWSLAGDGICVSNMPFANFQENIPNLANNYEPLKNLNFAHAQQTFCRVYSWNLKRICPYWVFSASSPHSCTIPSELRTTLQPHPLAAPAMWPPMQHGEGSHLIQMQRGQLFNNSGREFGNQSRDPACGGMVAVSVLWSAADLVFENISSEEH